MWNHFCLFGETIRLFSLMAGLGLGCILAAVLVQVRTAGIGRVLEAKLLEGIPAFVLFGALSAHFSDVFFHAGWRGLVDEPLSYGINFMGWVGGVLIVLAVYAPIRLLPFLPLCNFYLPSFAFAQAFGRIGCFCGGCCFGKPANFWGVVFPENSLPWKMYGTVPLIPVQLYESAFLFVFGTILFQFIPFRMRAGVYLIGLSLARFGFEFLRGDSRGSVTAHAWLSPAQCLGMLFLILGAVFLLWQKKGEIARLTAANRMGKKQSLPVE